MLLGKEMVMVKKIVAWDTAMKTCSYGTVLDEIGESLFIKRVWPTEGKTCLIHASKVREASAEELEDVNKRLEKVKN